MEKISDIQTKIYNYIKNEVRKKGNAPTIREICKYVGLSSTSTVHHHLNILEDKGYIRRPKSKNRCIEIMESDFYDGTGEVEYSSIPIIGTVAAGSPILAIENIEGYFPVPTDYLTNNVCFMLKIKGNSMVDAGIFNNDLVLVQQQNVADNGDIVIALIEDSAEDSATCKRFYREKDCIRLQPENEAYNPIYVKELTILGKVIGLFRSFK